MRCTIYSYGTKLSYESHVIDYDYDDYGNGIIQINIKCEYQGEQHEKTFFGCGLSMTIEGEQIMIKPDNGKIETLFNLKGEYVYELIKRIELRMDRENISLNDIRNVELINVSYMDGDEQFRLYINTNDKTLSVVTPNLKIIKYKDSQAFTNPP